MSNNLLLFLFFLLVGLWGLLNVRIVSLIWKSLLVRRGLLKPPYKLTKYFLSKPRAIAKFPKTIISSGSLVIDIKELFKSKKDDQFLSQTTEKARKCIRISIFFLIYLVIALIIVGGQVMPMVFVAFIGILILVYALLI